MGLYTYSEEIHMFLSWIFVFKVVRLVLYFNILFALLTFNFICHVSRYTKFQMCHTLCEATTVVLSCLYNLILK